MMPNQKNIMTRYSFIILMMVLIGIAIICKAGVIMFAERQYWNCLLYTSDAADE